MVTQPVLFLILAMAAVTYISRGPILAAAGRISLPDFIQHCLEVAPVAALATLTVSLVVYPGGEGKGWTENPSIYAALVTVGAALYFRNVLLILVVALVAFHLFRWILASA